MKKIVNKIKTRLYITPKPEHKVDVLQILQWTFSLIGKLKTTIKIIVL